MSRSREAAFHKREVEMLRASLESIAAMADAGTDRRTLASVQEEAEAALAYRVCLECGRDDGTHHGGCASK